MKEPHLFSLVLVNSGRQDIESSSFDQQRPLRWQITADAAMLIVNPDENPPGLKLEGNYIDVGPELLHARRAWRIDLVTDGQPKIELLENHLSNTRVLYLRSSLNKFIVSVGRIAVAVAAPQMEPVVPLVADVDYAAGPLGRLSPRARNHPQPLQADTDRRR